MGDFDFGGHERASSPHSTSDNMREYDMTKAEMTQLYDRVNQLTDAAADPGASNIMVVSAVDDLHAEAERLLPSLFWLDRDHEFDRLGRQVRAAGTTKRRLAIVRDFVGHLTDLILGELEVEP